MKLFVLNEDREMLQSLARNLARAEIRPRSEMVDHGPQTPAEGVRLLAEAGLVCCMVPEDLGGAGLDYWCQTSVVEETAKECASTAWAVAETASAAEGLLKHGSKAQQAAVLPQLAGGILAACGEAGQSDLTVAGSLLTGRVRRVPNAGVCGWYLLPAGEAWYLVKGDAPGLVTERGASLLGLKGCAPGDLVLNACPGEVLGGDVSATLSATRSLYMAAIAAGVAQGALDAAIAYVNQRVQFGRTIAQFENTQQVMAELLAKAGAARALTWDAAEVKDTGEDSAYAAALAKVVASDAAAVISRKCVQFMGGYGYSREYPVERKMRDAKMTELCGGPNEELKNLIAKTAVVR